MRIASVCFLIGICTVMFCSVALAGGFLLVAFILAILICFTGKQARCVALIPLLFFIVGGVYGKWHYHHQESIQKAVSYQTGYHPVIGVVDSRPMIMNNVETFIFKVASNNNEMFSHPARVKVSWYQYDKLVQAGERWQLMMHMKPVRGLANPGAEDRQKHYFVQNLQANAYVKSGDLNVKQEDVSPYHLEFIRERLQKILSSNLVGLDQAGLIEALALGVTDNIDQEDWRLFRVTGTSHLMSISGLHVGMVSGFVYYIMRLLLKRIPPLLTRISAAKIAAVFSLGAAAAYCIFAGFGVPSQRALIMLSVLMLGKISGSNFAHFTSWAIALFIVLIVHPFSVFMPGFWLSFAAVGLILYVLQDKKQSIILRYLKMQWVLCVGLLPLSLWFFGQISLVSPFVNLFAIPVVGFLVLPLCLLGLLTSVFFVKLPILLLTIANYLFSLLMIILHYVSDFSFSSVTMSIHHLWVFLLLLGGTMLLCARIKVYWQCVGLVGFLPLFYQDLPIKMGEVKVTLLDVGQGLSTVIQTAHHVLLYDTGPRFGLEFDAGEAVIVPYCRYENIRSIDKMIISHGDMDHKGGARSVMDNLPVLSVLTSIPHYSATVPVKQCHQGQHWSWDGVDFKIIYPYTHQHYDDNNSSCVLQVSVGRERILFTGDIEKDAENILLQNGADLKASLLIAPHHGSKTSSTEDFVKTVSPQLVLFATGFHNRYHFPHGSVVQRYKQFNAHMLNTSIVGAVTVLMSEKGGFLFETVRQE